MKWSMRFLGVGGGALGTFDAGFVRGEDPGVSAGRGADVEVKLDIVL